MRPALLPLVFIIIVVYYHRFVKIVRQHDYVSVCVCQFRSQWVFLRRQPLEN